MEEKIVKVCLNPELNVIYAFGESSKCTSWDFKEKKLISESFGLFSCTSVVYDKLTKSVLMSDNEGKIHIFDLSEVKTKKDFNNILENC
jgi:hypothetical protein